MGTATGLVNKRVSAQEDFVSSVPEDRTNRRSASVKDDRLDAINLLDLREQPLGHGGLRDDEAVWIIDDLVVVHDHLPNRDARLVDARRLPGQAAELPCRR